MEEEEEGGGEGGLGGKAQTSIPNLIQNTAQEEKRIRTWLFILGGRVQYILYIAY